MKTYEEPMKENEDLKNQLKMSISLEMYQDTLDENSKLKKKLKKAKAERNKLKYVQEWYIGATLSKLHTLIPGL